MKNHIMISRELFDLEVAQRMLSALKRLKYSLRYSECRVLSRAQSIPVRRILRELAEPIRDVPIFLIALPAMQICLTIQRING